ncbi:ArnT family glycosyltransferase [Mycobacterium sp. SMC-4]|uniref:ArnT family glycosyltransferase n=1 Tax=Mycobacterium sp. SMC-4 TaxID=2857059 RepID=UPI003D062CB9
MSTPGDLLDAPQAGDDASTGAGPADDSTSRTPGMVSQFAVFVGPLMVYALLPTQNHNYADDSLSWAYQLTQSGNLINSHHLYLNPMRWLYQLLLDVGLTVNPVSLLAFYSAVWGAIGLAVLYRLLVRAGLGKTALWGALLCGVSAGYWSYSIAGDVYIPAAALMIIGVYCVYCGLTTRRTRGARWYALAAVVAFTLMLTHHQAHVVFVLGLIPAVLLTRKATALRRALIGIAVPAAVCSLAVAIYAVAYLSLPEEQQHGFVAFGVGYVESFEPRADQKQIGIGTLANIAAGETRALVSTNVMFGNEEVAQAVQDRYPYRATYPFPYLVRDVPAPVAMLAGISAAIAMLLTALLSVRGLWVGLKERGLVLLVTVPMIPQLLFFAWWEGISDEFSLWTLPLVAILAARGAARMTHPLRWLRATVACVFVSTFVGSVLLYWNPANDIDQVNDGYISSLHHGDLLVGFEDIQSDFRIMLAADRRGFEYLNFFNVRDTEDVREFDAALDAAADAGMRIHISPRLTHPPKSAVAFKESVDPAFGSQRAGLLAKLAALPGIDWLRPAVFSERYFEGSGDV